MRFDPSPAHEVLDQFLDHLFRVCHNREWFLSIGVSLFSVAFSECHLHDTLLRWPSEIRNYFQDYFLAASAG